MSQERTLARKIREWILTPRMEKALTKDEILNLYVNTIYFGHGRYGVEEAALFYFGKHAKDLTLGEAAVLAGTVQCPHRINPVTNIVKAKKRQRYVLAQLAGHGFVTQAGRSTWSSKSPSCSGPRAAAAGRPVLRGGRAQGAGRALRREGACSKAALRVEIAMDPKLQAAAEASVRAGLEAVDRRPGLPRAGGQRRARRASRAAAPARAAPGRGGQAAPR